MCVTCTPDEPQPNYKELSQKDWRRIKHTPVGCIAYLHKMWLKEHGATVMTLQDSYEIRRDIYGAKIRASASLFGQGPEHDQKILQRMVDYGQPNAPGDPVRLTPEGERLAFLYEKYRLGN